MAFLSYICIKGFVMRNRNSKIRYCKKTKKYCYSSEAKATRAMNRYKDIKRVYFCKSCNSFHTTSISKDVAIKEGIIEEEPNQVISKTQITKQIKKLKEKIRRAKCQKNPI